MKKLSLQWRITIMTVLLIGASCVTMHLLMCSSGIYYMDSIGSFAMTFNDVMTDDESEFFDPALEGAADELTIVVHGAQEDFCKTNWFITAGVTLMSGVLAYFISGRTLMPLHNFAEHIEQVQLNNLGSIQLDENALPEFREPSRSFNRMLRRLDSAFDAQRQFTGNAAHELRTPLALMQAQLELFAAEHPDVLPETAEFISLLQEQTERLTQMTQTLLEINGLKSASRTDIIDLQPMVEEIFTDLAPLAENNETSLEYDGEGTVIGSDTLIYRLLFNLTENAVKYNKHGGSVHVSIREDGENVGIKIKDTGCGIPEEYQRSIFQPFFRVDKSRSREFGGAGLGLSLVWEVAELHGGKVYVEESSPDGTVIAVLLPKKQG